MRLESLQACALALPQTNFVKQWGENLVFKVAGRMFLIVSLDGALAESAIFKCRPEEFDALTENDGIEQAPYCAKRLWVKVSDLDALPAAEFERRIRQSYDLVVAKLSKKIRRALAS